MVFGHVDACRKAFVNRNASGPFHARMLAALHGLVGKICQVWVDDILVWGNSEEQLIANWKLVLDALALTGFKLNIHKTKFFRPELVTVGA